MLQQKESEVNAREEWWFYATIQDVQDVLQSVKWGPRIWGALDEDSRDAIRNLVKIDSQKGSL